MAERDDESNVGAATAPAHGRQGASRRTVLLSAGAVGAAGILAACGDEAPTDTPTPTTAPQTAPPTSGAEETAPPAADAGLKVSDVPVGGGLIVKEDNIVVTQPSAGQFKAFSATCTHMQCQLVDVAEQKINCECHGSQFSINDGSVMRGPATRSLVPRTVTVNGDTLTVG